MSYRDFLQEIGETIRNRALEAKEELRSCIRDTADFHFGGRLMAFNEVVSILQQEALGFDIPLEDLGLQGLNPDRDLSPP